MIPHVAQKRNNSERASKKREIRKREKGEIARPKRKQRKTSEERRREGRDLNKTERCTDPPLLEKAQLLFWYLAVTRISSAIEKWCPLVCRNSGSSKEHHYVLHIISPFALPTDGVISCPFRCSSHDIDDSTFDECDPTFLKVGSRES